MQNFLKCMFSVALLLAITACSTHKVYQSDTITASSRWLLLPISNLTQAPLAGERTEAILASHLRATGLGRLTEYPRSTEQNRFGLNHDQIQLQQAKVWAKSQSAQYWVTGTVDEWQYKAGLDGEPAIGISLKIIDANTEQVIWSASGARTGWGREGVAVAMHQLIEELLAELNLD